MGSLASPLASPLGGDTVETTPQVTRMLKLLLPPGVLLNVTPDSWLSKTLDAIGVELAYVIQRGADLIGESLPDQANETIDQWARELALPDEAVPTFVGLTTAQKQNALTQKYTGRGGQSPAFFIALAESCGYTSVSILDDYWNLVFRSGKARSGDRCYDYDWAFVWKMTAHAGSGALPTSNLEAVIRRAAPSHTTVLFTYI